MVINGVVLGHYSRILTCPVNTHQGQHFDAGIQDPTMCFGQRLLFAALRPVSVLPVVPLAGSVTVMTDSAPTTRKHFALLSHSDIPAVVTLACSAQEFKHRRVGPLDAQRARLLLLKV